MRAGDGRSHIYVGLGGEGSYIGPGGLYRRTEGEQEWQSITNGLPQNPQVRALVVHPKDPRIIYAGTHVGVFRSGDYGEHWEPLEKPWKGKDVWSLTFHPHDSATIYAGYEPCAIYRSTNGGESWQKMNTDRVVFPRVTVHPVPQAKRVIGTTSDPSDAQEMYAAIEVGGLLASRDGGENWECITDGLYLDFHTLDLHGVLVSPAAPGNVFIITRIGLFRSRDRGGHWERVAMEEMFPGGSYCRGIQLAPDASQTVYLAAGSGGGAAPAGIQEAGALFRSRDVGETWERVGLGETPSGRMMEIAVDPARRANVYCCARLGQVYSSHDSGATWSKEWLPAEMSNSLHPYRIAVG